MAEVVKFDYEKLLSGLKRVERRGEGMADAECPCCGGDMRIDLTLDGDDAEVMCFGTDDAEGCEEDDVRQALTMGAREWEYDGPISGTDLSKGKMPKRAPKREALPTETVPRAIGMGFRGDRLMSASFPPPKWALDGIIPQGLSLLAGKTKRGKSYLLTDLAQAVALGGEVLGKKVAQGDVLFLALEDTARRVQQRLRSIVRHRFGVGKDGGPTEAEMNARLCRLEVQHMAAGWPRWDDKPGCLEKLKEWIGNNPSARLIIIDTLAKVRPSKAKDRDQSYTFDESMANDLYTLANEKGVSIVLVHHARKTPTEDQWDSILGSSAFQGYFDGLMLLERKPRDEKAVLHVKGRDIEEASWVLLWNREGEVFDFVGSKEEVEQETESAKEPTKSQKAMKWLPEVLANGPIATKEMQALAAKTSLGWSTVEAAKTALGIIETFKEGTLWYWRLHRTATDSQPVTEEVGAAS